MALKFSPGFEVQLTVIKEVSPVHHTGDKWETIWYWAVIRTEGLGCCGLETMRASWEAWGLGKRLSKVWGEG